MQINWTKKLAGKCLLFLSSVFSLLYYTAIKLCRISFLESLSVNYQKLNKCWQTYHTNKAKVVFLKQRRQQQVRHNDNNNSKEYRCIICHKSLQDNSRYCSIACKVSYFLIYVYTQCSFFFECCIYTRLWSWFSINTSVHQYSYQLINKWKNQIYICTHIYIYICMYKYICINTLFQLIMCCFISV